MLRQGSRRGFRPRPRQGRYDRVGPREEKRWCTSARWFEAILWPSTTGGGSASPRLARERDAADFGSLSLLDQAPSYLAQREPIGENVVVHEDRFAARPCGALHAQSAPQLAIRH